MGNQNCSEAAKVVGIDANAGQRHKISRYLVCPIQNHPDRKLRGSEASR